MTLEDRVQAQRLFAFQRAAELHNVSAACRELGLSRALFYRPSGGEFQGVVGVREPRVMIDLRRISGSSDRRRPARSREAKDVPREA
jgi:hypothetical protein